MAFPQADSPDAIKYLLTVDPQTPPKFLPGKNIISILCCKNYIVLANLTLAMQRSLSGPLMPYKTFRGTIVAYFKPG